MSKLVLDVTKDQFKNRVLNAIEGAMKSPLVKKKNQVVNAAMVQLLHGGNGAGQNEHNLDTFWEKNLHCGKEIINWMAVDNFKLESDENNDFHINLGVTKDEVLNKLYMDVFEEVSLCVTDRYNIDRLVKILKQHASAFFESYLFDNEVTVESLTELDASALIDGADILPLSAKKALFEFLTSMSSVSGEYLIHELNVVCLEPPKKSVTIHTIIQYNYESDYLGDTTNIDNIDVSTTLSAEEHDKVLLGLFRQLVKIEDNPSFNRDNLLEHSVVEDIMSEHDLDIDDFDSYSDDQLIDRLCKFGRPNQLIDIIPDATFNLIRVEVQYKEEFI